MINEKNINDIKKEPYKIYYRVCLIFLCVILPPLILVLGYRLYKIFITRQPAIYPDCDNIGLKIGKALLIASKIFLFLFMVILSIILFLASSGKYDSLNGIPAGIVLAPGFYLLLIAIPLIELSQISHRKLKQK